MYSECFVCPVALMLRKSIGEVSKKLGDKVSLVGVCSLLIRKWFVGSFLAVISLIVLLALD